MHHCGLRILGQPLEVGTQAGSIPVSTETCSIAYREETGISPHSGAHGREQISSELLTMDNLQGLAAVGPCQSSSGVAGIC